MLAELRNGALDMVTTLVDHDVLEGLESVRLFDAELVVVAALDHPLAQAEDVPVARLADEALIAPNRESPLRDTLLALAPDAHVVLEANQLDTVLDFIARGLGITLMTRSVAAQHQQRLAIRPLSPPHTLPLTLIWRAREELTPAARAFKEHVLSAVPAGPER
jgi:DNA-binding transcriptional LysR family regulator